MQILSNVLRKERGVRTRLELLIQKVHLVQKENECGVGKKLAFAYAFPEVERVQLCRAVRMKSRQAWGCTHQAIYTGILLERYVEI